MTSAISREQLEEGARRILLSNLREGVADWNGKEFSFVCPSLTGYPFQWFWDSCFHAIALLHLDPEQAKKEMRSLMERRPAQRLHPSHHLLGDGEAARLSQPQHRRHDRPQLQRHHPAAHHRLRRGAGVPGDRRRGVPARVAAHPDPLLPIPARGRDPDNDGLVAVIQPEEAGTDCSPKYDEILGLEELSNRGFITALRKVYEAYEPLRHDDHAVLAADIFHVEDVLVNSIYCFCLRALARLHTEVGGEDSPEAAEFNREADKVRDALVEKCWDEEAGAFFDLSGVDEKPLKTVTISSLMPLILADLPRHQVETLGGRGGCAHRSTSGRPTRCPRCRRRTRSSCPATPAASSGEARRGSTPTTSCPTPCAATATPS